MVNTLLPKNCLSVFEHFVGFALRGLMIKQNQKIFFSSKIVKFARKSEFIE